MARSPRCRPKPARRSRKGRASWSSRPRRSIHPAAAAPRPVPPPPRPWFTGGMALHLIKLCVGCDSIADLEAWIEENRAHHRRLGRTYEQTHTTRMVPKRMSELVGGGSLFWVIKGQVSCRQRLLAVRPFTDASGIGRCLLVLEPTVTVVEPRPYRPFQ